MVRSSIFPGVNAWARESSTDSATSKGVSEGVTIRCVKLDQHISSHSLLRAWSRGPALPALLSGLLDGCKVREVTEIKRRLGMNTFCSSKRIVLTLLIALVGRASLTARAQENAKLDADKIGRAADTKATTAPDGVVRIAWPRSHSSASGAPSSSTTRTI